MIKVFISSKQGELDPEREVLNRAFQSPQWDNFTFEFSGAFTDSARDIYLKQVSECDVYLGIFAGLYSQATVDEYHRAKELGKPILIYLKRHTDRDPQLKDLISAELKPSHKFQEYSTTEELISHLADIRRAVDAQMHKYKRQVYLKAIIGQTQLLELAGIVDSDEQERPKLRDVFVALSAAKASSDSRILTLNEVLSTDHKLVILGGAGTGKSTLLRYLTLMAAQKALTEREIKIEAIDQLSPAPNENLGLPIMIRLSDFAKSGQSLIEYFETYIAKQFSVSLGNELLERSFEDGQVLVCLDGLDEVFQPAQRIETRNAVAALAKHYPHNRFVVTSRAEGYSSTCLDEKEFAHYTIMPFGETEIQLFVEKWYDRHVAEPTPAKARADSLLNDLRTNKHLLELAQNPLMLTIIVLVHQHAQSRLPDVRVELYDRCAETLIEEWDTWKGLAPEDRQRPYYQLRRRLLERLAYWMHLESHETDVAQVSKRVLEAKVAEFLSEDRSVNLSADTARIEAKQFVALATSRTGILQRSQETLSFVHLSFEEYLAASDLYWRYRKTPNELWEAIQPRLYDARWLEVILTLLERLNDDGEMPSIIVERILQEHDTFDEVLHRNLFLATRCMAAQVRLKAELKEHISDSLYALARDPQPDFPALKADALNAMTTLTHDPHAYRNLLSLVQDDAMCLAQIVMGESAE